MISSAQVAVSATAAALHTALGLDQAQLTVRAGASDLFVGGSGVTATTGFKVTAGTTQQFVLDQGEVLYGILATGTDTCFTLVCPHR